MDTSSVVSDQQLSASTEEYYRAQALRMRSLGAMTRLRARLTYGDGFIEGWRLVPEAPELRTAPGMDETYTLHDIWFTNAVKLLYERMPDMPAKVVGFHIDDGTGKPITINYGQPRSICKQPGRVLMCPPSMGSGRALYNAAEERLVHALRLGNETWRNMAGYRMSMPLANRLASAVVSIAIYNAVDETRLPMLATLRAMAPTLRRPLAWLLDPAADGKWVHEALVGAPILSLFPRQLFTANTRGIRDIMQSVGLPRGASKLKHQPTGTIAYWRKWTTDDIDLGDDLAWLTSHVCGALPAAAFRQRIVADTMCLMSMYLNAVELLQPYALWLCQEVETVKRENEFDHTMRRLLVDYMLADPRALDAVQIDGWTPHITLAKAIYNAKHYTQYTHLLQGAPTGMEFAKPYYALPDGPMPHSRWYLVRLTSPAALVGEGIRMDNCLACYLDRTLTGRSVVYSIRRAATRADAGRKTVHCPVIGGEAITGANLEIVAIKAKPRITQLLGPRNTEAPASIHNAIQRLLPREV